MADLDALRIEYEAAVAVLLPQIRGLEDLLQMSTISTALDEALREQLTTRLRRQALLVRALGSLDAVDAAQVELADDGYAILNKLPIELNLFEELSGDVADLESALATFEAALRASTIVVSLSEPTDKST